MSVLSPDEAYVWQLCKAAELIRRNGIRTGLPAGMPSSEWTLPRALERAAEILTIERQYKPVGAELSICFSNLSKRMGRPGYDSERALSYYTNDREKAVSLILEELKCWRIKKLHVTSRTTLVLRKLREIVHTWYDTGHWTDERLWAKRITRKDDISGMYYYNVRGDDVFHIAWAAVCFQITCRATIIGTGKKRNKKEDQLKSVAINKDSDHIYPQW